MTNNVERWHLELARSLSEFAREMTPASIELSDDLSFNAQRFWNVGFLIAAIRLVDAIVLLTEKGLGNESAIQLRCLLELVGNLNYMNADRSRALQFAAAEALGRKRLANLVEHYGLGDEAARRELADSIAQDLEEMASSLGEALEDDSLARMPFGVKARTRIESSPSLEPYYDIVYARISDFLHMNARAVASYLREPDEETYAYVAMGNEFLLRVMFSVDEVLDLGRRGTLDGYAAQYAKKAFPKQSVSQVLARLRD